MTDREQLHEAHAHRHGPGCGHTAIHEERLHHHHGDHCDDHGPVEVVQREAGRWHD